MQNYHNYFDDILGVIEIVFCENFTPLMHILRSKILIYRKNLQYQFDNFFF